MKVALSNTQSNAPALLWDPARQGVENSRLAEFTHFVRERTGQSFGGYDHGAFLKLHDWSVKDPENFWDAVWDFAGVIGDKNGPVLRATDQVPWARFFPEAKISYAENLLGHTDASTAPAVIARTQNGPDRILSWKDLRDQVSLWQQALEHAGVKEGDRVAVYLPNVPESIIILLAASNIGAIFSSAGMEMGQSDLINRFSQVKPKILVTAKGYAHGEKFIDRKNVTEAVKAAIPSLENVIVLPRNGENDFIAPFTPRALTFTRRDFNHPLYILFSSGSTGKPKCFEHSTGGVMLKHLSEYLLHCEIRPGDRVFYHATPSWMMWNWLTGALATGATILLYDGSPAYPDPYAQWEFTAAHKCTHHGTAAPVILSWEQNKLTPRDRYDLSDLRMIMSTGAVLPRQGFEFIHRAVKENIKIGSISGGTDIVGCFVGGNAFTPTYAGQINGPMLGCDVRVWNDDGQEVKPGEAGELVCVNPFPSMPLRFADDPDGRRYSSEYFEFYPGKHVWRHGDSIEKSLQGQFVIIGRSDATLNQNGVRIGTVAIYDQLKPFSDQIKEAAAIDFTRPDNKQTITVLFLVMQDGSSEVPAELKNSIKRAVKDHITPYAIPTEIMAVPGILKTPNGKIAEVVMKKVVGGKSVPNASLYGEDLVAYYQGIGRALSEKYGQDHENGLKPSA